MKPGKCPSIRRVLGNGLRRGAIGVVVDHSGDFRTFVEQMRVIGYGPSFAFRTRWLWSPTRMHGEARRIATFILEAVRKDEEVLDALASYIVVSVGHSNYPRWFTVTGQEVTGQPHVPRVWFHPTATLEEFHRVFVGTPNIAVFPAEWLKRRIESDSPYLKPWLYQCRDAMQNGDELWSYSSPAGKCSSGRRSGPSEGGVALVREGVPIMVVGGIRF